MKVYCQLTINGKEALGTFNVRILDARCHLYNLVSMGMKAMVEEKNFGINGFRIIRSENFVNSDENKSSTIYEYNGAS